MLRAEGRIQWDKRRGSPGAFWLIVRIRCRQPEAPPDLASTARMVALDPGCRAFQTYYDPKTGEHGELLHRMADGPTTVKNEMARRCERIDHLQSRIARRKGQSPNLPMRQGLHLAHQFDTGQLSAWELWARIRRAWPR